MKDKNNMSNISVKETISCHNNKIMLTGTHFTVTETKVPTTLVTQGTFCNRKQIFSVFSPTLCTQCEQYKNVIETYIVFLSVRADRVN